MPAKKQNKQLEGFAPGIYFGIPEDEYHADPALNYSSIKHLLNDPNIYWKGSAMCANPKKMKESDEMKFGKAVHHMLLEPETFFKKYYVMPGSKIDPDREMIARYNYDKMEAAVQAIRRNKFTNTYFSDGYPEVTMVWDCPFSGIRMRSRTDWLREYPSVDLKITYDISNLGIKRGFWNFGYEVQYALYKEGTTIIKDLLRSGEIKAWWQPGVEFEDVDFLARFITDPDEGFIFVFQRDNEPFNARALRISEHDAQEGIIKVRDGKDKFLEYLKKFGTDTPWRIECEGIEDFSTSFSR